MNALSTVEDWPVTHASVGVVGFRPYGGHGDSLGGVGRHPDSDRLATYGPVDRKYPWASVTKPATALAVLVAVEEGTLDLDQPAGPSGSTVRHLLAHASGLGMDGGVVAPPGTSRIYSNAGFVLLGDLLAERSGIGFDEYLRLGVLEPLGMAGTEVAGDPSGGSAAGLAGPLGDLLALGREWAVPTLVSGETHRAAASPQFPGLAGVVPGFGRFDPCPWGLGVEIRGSKWPHWTGRGNSDTTYGHFGRSGSFLWVDPVAGLICAGLADRPFGVWASGAWPRLADTVLAEWSGSAQSTG